MVVPYTPPPIESAEGLVTRLAGRVQGATGWMRFVGVVCVIGGALGVLGLILALLAGAVIQEFEGQLGQDIPSDFRGFLIGVHRRGPGLRRPLHLDRRDSVQAADGIRDAHRHGAVAELEHGLGKVRVFFVIVGHRHPRRLGARSRLIHPLAQRGIYVHSEHRGHRRSGVTELSIRLRCHASPTRPPVLRD